jgi:sulfinoalanine decarboxylase/sulfinoalanine decarboxylase/aspartate 1-decarboxylase
VTVPRREADTSADPLRGSSVPLHDALTALRALVDEHLARELTEPVRAPRDPADIRAAIDLSVGPARPFDQVVEDLRAVLALTPSTASPRFFNQLFGGRDGAAVLGDLLATVLNTSMYTYKVGGVHVLIELELARRMGALMGLPDAEGVFAPGGSLSNLTAMMLARDRARPDLGAPGAAGPLRALTLNGPLYRGLDHRHLLLWGWLGQL